MDFLIEGIAVALALSALLLQPRRNPAEPASWKNLSNAGRLVLFLVLLAGTAKIVKQVTDSVAARRSAIRQENTITDLRATNQLLVKVMSVADGYNAHVLGIAVFKKDLPGPRLEEALRNIFLKSLSIDLRASNSLGFYTGRIDYGAHPVLFKYLNVSRLESTTPLLSSLPSLSEQERSRSFFFDIRCANLKILNQDKIEYARTEGDPRVWGDVTIFPDSWSDFRTFYGLQEIFVDKVTLEELGDVEIRSH
jgi:hypothetical protein